MKILVFDYSTMLCIAFAIDMSTVTGILTISKQLYNKRSISLRLSVTELFGELNIEFIQHHQPLRTPANHSKKISSFFFVKTNRPTPRFDHQ